MKKVLLTVFLGISSFVPTSFIYASKSDSSSSSQSVDVQKVAVEVKVGDIVWLENNAKALVISHVYPNTGKVDLKPKKANDKKESDGFYKGVSFEKLYFQKLIGHYYGGNSEGKKIVSFRDKNKPSYGRKQIRYGLVKGVNYDQTSVLLITATGRIFYPGLSKVYSTYFKHKEQLHQIRKLGKVKYLHSMKYKKPTRAQRFFGV